MDLGSEITTRLKTSIKTKLQELGSYIDDELPEYILVMISNKRSPNQMKEDLSLFLGDETDKFVAWVFAVLAKLQEATDGADVEAETEIGLTKDPSDIAKETKKQIHTNEVDNDEAIPAEKSKRKLSNSEKDKSRGEKETTNSGTEISKAQNKAVKSEEAKKGGTRKDSGSGSSSKKDKKKEKEEPARKQVGQKRQHSSDEEEEESTGGKVMASKVEVQKKAMRPSLPVARQASGNLIKKAMEEAAKSVNKPGVVAAHEYSHDNCESVVWINDPELREQQKQVLLRQHRELKELRNIKDQLKKQKAIIDQSVSPGTDPGHGVSNGNNDIEIDEKDGIELEVNDNEFVEEWIEVDSNPKDRRVIDVGNDVRRDDGGDDVPGDESGHQDISINADTSLTEDLKVDAAKDSHDSKEGRKDSRREVKDVLSRSGRDRHSKRRHRHRDHDRHHSSEHKQFLEGGQENIGGGLLSPKFVVTLNGVDSDYEKKFEDEHRRERRRRKFNDKVASSSSDTLFINLDKRTSNLKPLEIMQQALLTIQQPLLQGQVPLLPSNFDTPNQALPLPKPHSEVYGTFDLRNHLLPQSNILPPQNTGPQAVNVNQPQVPQNVPVTRLNQNTTRNLTNLVPLAFAPSQKDSPEEKIMENVGTVRNNTNELQAVPPVEKVRIRVDSGSADDEEVEMETETILERCKFWPECKNGVSCVYVHPTVPCKSFPNCSYSNKCIFLHPVCKFDGRCNNVSCPYTHTSKQKVFGGIQAAPGMLGSVDQNTPLCRFYPNCSKKFCPFRHPIGKPCRYGSACTRSNCLFAHETKPAERGALTWTAVTKEQKGHVSNRKFACADSSVTATPVSVST